MITGRQRDGSKNSEMTKHAIWLNSCYYQKYLKCEPNKTTKQLNWQIRVTGTHYIQTQLSKSTQRIVFSQKVLLSSAWNITSRAAAASISQLFLQTLWHSTVNPFLFFCTTNCGFPLSPLVLFDSTCNKPPEGKSPVMSWTTWVAADNTVYNRSSTKPPLSLHDKMKTSQPACETLSFCFVFMLCSPLHMHMHPSAAQHHRLHLEITSRTSASKVPGQQG